MNYSLPGSIGFSRQEYWSCHSLLQGIFPTQGLNLGLPHCRQILYHLSHQGRLVIAILKPYRKRKPKNQDYKRGERDEKKIKQKLQAVWVLICTSWMWVGQQVSWQLKGQCGSFCSGIDHSSISKKISAVYGCFGKPGEGRCQVQVIGNLCVWWRAAGVPSYEAPLYLGQVCTSDFRISH